MSGLLYLAQSLGWTIVGFMLGYLVAGAAADVSRIAAAIPEATVDTSRQTTHRRWRPSGQWVLGVIVILLGIVTVVQGIVTGAETRRLTECQSTYANAFADALDARAAASADAQNALDEMVVSIGQYVQAGPGHPEEIRGAIRNYLAARDAAKAEQAAHPYPPPPRTCT